MASCTGSYPGSTAHSVNDWLCLSCTNYLSVCQAGAEVLVQPTASAAREVFWELADGLMRPCSLFDAGDTLLLHKMAMELANSNLEQAAAMQQAFFGSSQVGVSCQQCIQSDFVCGAEAMPCHAVLC